MNTIKNKKIFFKVYVNGSEVNGLMKNGVKFYEKTSPYFMLEYTDNSDMFHSEVVSNAKTLKNTISNIKNILKKCRIISYGGIDAENLTGYTLFSYFTNLIELDLTNFNTRNITDMYYMFGSCSNLTTLDLSNFDTSKVTNMYGMFAGCSNLTTLDLSNFDTSKVTSMHVMFGSCSNLTTLDLSNFNTSKVTNMRDIFSNCSNLTTLDLSNFDTSKVTDMYGMFRNCFNLEELDISNFNFTNVTNTTAMFLNIPKNCLIYVKDQTAKDFVLNVRNDLTNVVIKT